MVIGVIGLEGIESERLGPTNNKPTSYIGCAASTGAVRSSSRPMKDTTGLAFNHGFFEVSVFRKSMVGQRGPLAGQVKSPRERVKLNGLIGATRSSSFA